VEDFNIASMFFTIIVIGLIVLFVVSFTLFIRRIIKAASAKSNLTNDIEKKLDRIIDLLEKDKNS
jgi:biopolymer transport protein ExbB/TolQ